MWIFVAAGFLYLVGVAVMLVIRPTYMFTPEGEWKEFGIGKREDRYTPFPFWMFCLAWAIVAYVTVLLLWPLVTRPQVMNSGVAEAIEPLPLPSNTNNRRNRGNNNKSVNFPVNEGAQELPKGYYVLNKKATRLSGVPKYVYLGPEA